MVSTDPQDTAQSIEGFRGRGEIEDVLPWAVDQEGQAAAALGVNALETTVILNENGEVVYRDTSSTDYETLQGELEKIR